MSNKSEEEEQQTVGNKPLGQRGESSEYLYVSMQNINGECTMCTTVVAEENEEENEIPSPIKSARVVYCDENVSVENTSGQLNQEAMLISVSESNRESERVNSESINTHSFGMKKGEKEEKVVIVDAIHESEIQVNVTTEGDLEVDVDAIVEGVVSVHMEGRPEDLMTLVQRDVNISAPQGMFT